MLLKDSFVVQEVIILNIAENIKAFRSLKKLSQKEVALTIGIDQAQYSRIESGKVEPTVSSLKKIADALGIAVGDFFSDEKPVDVNSFDADLVGKLKLLAQLDKDELKSICHIIDIAVNKKRLKDSLSNALEFS
jgi:transcriptional regulator with XRE-family HTH domain